MNVTTTDLTIENLKQSIENHMKHSYIEKFIKKPVIDEDKLFLLSAIIQHTNVSIHKQKNYIITTMLVQIALDTHDLVTMSDAAEESDDKRKTRQLTVLAGDYYSGLYYHLLSKLEDISMIRTLASAIKEINEYKMHIYYKEFESPEAFFDAWNQVDSLLIQRISEHINKPVIIEFAKNWLLLTRLIREKNSFNETHTSPFVELLTQGPALQLSDKQFIQTIDQCIQRYAAKVNESVSQLPESFNMLRTYIINRLPVYFNKRKMVTEEG
ncbi:heptaprenyl diphosphate synthase component 1 [Radiobacillus sp. PE A8.2]|uniref:heptaprenyl diphosphate synthase component 1 n=1 Tax=Radiobacillus sp. PE A8.2 TaxID=3380349 RepID=UPI00389106A1